MMARLYVKNDAANGLAAHFERQGSLTGKTALRHMRRVAQLVLEQSIRNSPVDWKGQTRREPPGFELEKSHRIEEEYGDDRRLRANVVVGGTVGGVNVDKYAYWLHNNFDWNLGKASQQKMMQSPKNKVGPLFLERALAEYDHEFDDILGEVFDDLMR